jgi:hypothetical protein
LGASNARPHWPRKNVVNLPFDLPPWMLWTAAGLTGGAVLGLVGGAWRSRQRRPATISSLTFQPLPNAVPAVPAGRPLRTPTFIPPAPLAAAPPVSGSELRTDFRRPGNPVLVLVADADDQRTPWNAWVIDRSRRGLRLAVEKPLIVGHHYTVRPAKAPATTPWTALEVRHSAEVDDHWEVGCRFLQPPSVAVLMLYG